MSLGTSNPPLVSADTSDPTGTIDIAAGSAGFSGRVDMCLAAPMAKSFTPWSAGGVAGASRGCCDSGSKGADEIWNIFLICAPQPSVIGTGTSELSVQSIARASNVATIEIPGHPLGVGCTIVVGGPNGGFSELDGAYPITAVTSDTISFASTGPDFAAESPPTFGQWGLPVVAGFDVIASQSLDPELPPGFTLKALIATVTTDGSGNIASVTNVPID